MGLTGKNRVVIAFGSNLGDKESNIQKAISALGKTCGTVAQVSTYFKSKPEGFASENEFINGCLLLLTDLTPLDLLQNLKEIERSMGRIKTTSHYEDRSIDLDIIFYEHICLNTPELQIPHPKFQERVFVLEPLKELNLGLSMFESL